MLEIITGHPQFFIATSLERRIILSPDKYKDIIIESMRFLVKDNLVWLLVFSVHNQQRLFGRTPTAKNM
jgi:putative transposase